MTKAFSVGIIIFTSARKLTGVPALSCLRADDYLFTTHRNHGHLFGPWRRSEETLR